MQSEIVSGEVQEKVEGVWRTVMLNGIPVQDNRKANLPPYVHPGYSGARLPPFVTSVYFNGTDISDMIGTPFKVTLH